MRPDAEIPSWADLVALMCQEPKPPFRAVVHQRQPAQEARRAGDRRVTVLHDGVALWLITDGDEWRLGSGGDAVFFDRGTVKAVRGFDGVSFENGIRALFHGGLGAYLPNAVGEVVGSGHVAERDCWLARASALRSDEPNATFQFAVDKETGFVLEQTRDDMPELLTRVEDIVIGDASSPRPRLGRPPKPPRRPPPSPVTPTPPGAPRFWAISASMTDEELRRALFGDEPPTKT